MAIPRSTSRRALVGVLASGALIASLSACASSSDDSASEEHTDALRIAVEQAPDALDPATLGDNRSIEVGQNVYRGLTAVDLASGPVPDLTTWETDDSQTYTFTVVDGATYQNGEPVTAQDIADNINRVLDPETASGYTFFLELIQGAAEVVAGEAETASGITVIDDSTLEIVLTQPAAYFTSIASRWPYWIVDPEAFGTDPMDWAGFGTGDYELVEASGDTEYTFTAADGADVAISDVELTVVPDAATRLARYEAGEFDAIFNLNAETLALAQQDEELSSQLGTTSQLRTTWLNMDMDQAPFDDQLVREAFNAAIDKDELVSIALGGLGTPTDRWIPEGTPLIDAPDTDVTYSFDATTAQDLLAEAGYADGEGFPEVTLTIADKAEHQAVAEYVQQALSTNLGIDIQIEVLPQAAFNESLGSEDQPALFMYSFGLDYPDPQEILEYFGTSTGFVNFSHYYNEEYDALVQTGNTSQDDAERTEAYTAAESLYLDSAPIVPLYNATSAWLAKDYVEGVGVDVLYMIPWSEASFTD